jgi:hypothetical protein
MDVTPQQRSGGDVQHFADRFFAERGVRLGRVAMIQPRLDDTPAERILAEEDDSGGMSVPDQNSGKSQVKDNNSVSPTKQPLRPPSSNNAAACAQRQLVHLSDDGRRP